MLKREAFSLSAVPSVLRDLSISEDAFSAHVAAAQTNCQRRRMSNEQRNFLALPYEELEELNLKAKD